MGGSAGKGATWICREGGVQGVQGRGLGSCGWGVQGRGLGS